MSNKRFLAFINSVKQIVFVALRLNFEGTTGLSITKGFVTTDGNFCIISNLSTARQYRFYNLLDYSLVKNTAMPVTGEVRSIDFNPEFTRVYMPDYIITNNVFTCRMHIVRYIENTVITTYTIPVAVRVFDVKFVRNNGNDYVLCPLYETETTGSLLLLKVTNDVITEIGRIYFTGVYYGMNAYYNVNQWEIFLVGTAGLHKMRIVSFEPFQCETIIDVTARYSDCRLVNVDYTAGLIYVGHGFYSTFTVYDQTGRFLEEVRHNDLFAAVYSVSPYASNKLAVVTQQSIGSSRSRILEFNRIS